MADPVDESRREPDTGVLTPMVPPVRRQARSFSGRFRAAYVGLTLVFWVAVAAGTLLVTRGTGGGGGTEWSAWKPTATDFEGARQIASHVAAQYRLGDGSQLVAVQAHAPEVSKNVPLAAVALRGGGGEVPVFSARHSLMYILCGLGTSCAIDTGRPTKERARLLRREALELALYTFKYIEGVDSVIALLPPSDQDTNWSVYLREGDIKQQLAEPLRQTLPAAKPLTPDDPFEVDTVDRLTGPRAFKSQFQQLQDGEAILVLDPLGGSG